MTETIERYVHLYSRLPSTAPHKSICKQLRRWAEKAGGYIKDVTVKDAGDKKKLGFQKLITACCVLQKDKYIQFLINEHGMTEKEAKKEAEDYAGN